MATTAFDIVPVAIADDLNINVASHTSLSTPVLTGDSGGEGDNTGLMIWAGAHALCQYLWSNRNTFSAYDIVEFGIGSGLTTAVACKTGAQVFGTDGSPSAVDLARETLRLNDISARFAVFDWTATSPDPMFKVSRRLDKPGVIVAAEIVYPSTTEECLHDLFRCVVSMLSWEKLYAYEHFVMSYVQRQAETTLRLLQQAWRCNLTWRVVPWHTYAASKPPLDAIVLIFYQRDISETLEAHIASTFPDLIEQVERAKRAREEAEAEAAAFTLPAGVLD